MMTGILIKTTGSQYMVQVDGQVYPCLIKGKFRIKGLRTTNPLAVGDVVDFEPGDGDLPGVISAIHPRRNYIIRRSVNLSKEAQIIAANLDLAILVVTLHSPPTTTGFIDRFLVTAESYHIPVHVVFNKSDLYKGEDLVDLAILKDTCKSAGYPVSVISARNTSDIEHLKSLLKDKTTLFSGHSGAGKSTLINALCPALQVKTGNISDYHKKGQHTTTFAEMFPLPFGGYIIDTPGIKGFGLVDMKPEELAMYFPEMRDKLSECRFHNCKHLNEPGCAVIEAIESGEIFPSRYNSYLSMLQELEPGGKYREDQRG